MLLKKALKSGLPFRQDYSSWIICIRDTYGFSEYRYFGSGDRVNLSISESMHDNWEVMTLKGLTYSMHERLVCTLNVLNSKADKKKKRKNRS